MNKKAAVNVKPIKEQIEELERNFRIFEKDKRNFSEDSQANIRKQRATIEKLTRENRKMKAELNDSRQSGGTQAENRMALETVSKLKDHDDVLSTSLDEEQALNRILDEKLDTTSKAIFAVRQQMAAHGGVNASLENTKAVQKQIRILENRLNHALQKFNQAIASNKILREQIDTLRRERLVFDDIYKKLENELQQKKKEMANIIQQANAAYEARDSAQQQMAQLKTQADKEHSEFEKEWKELGRLIESDKRMKEFMRQKAAPSAAVTGNTQPIAAGASTKKAGTRHPDASVAAENNLMAIEAKIKAKEETFERIQKATGFYEIDTLVKNFEDAEDENFSLFKYNNLLRVEIEQLEQQIADYTEEHIQLSGNGSRKEDTEKLKILHTLEEKWTDIERRADTYDIKYQESQQTLAKVRSGIGAIFVKLPCGVEDLPPGCGAGISEANMMSYLGVIEKQTSELLKKCDDDDQFATKTRAMGTGTSMPTRLPSTVEDCSDDDDDDEEDDQRPFTREELKAKTGKAIKKKERKARMKSGNAGEK